MKKTNLPPHWQIKRLGDVCEKISLNKIKIKQKDYMESGKYPVIDQGQTLIGGSFNDENLLVPGEPPYIIFGDHTKIKKYVNFKFIAGADGVKVLKPHPFLHPKYFFYVIHTVKIPDKGYARHFQFLEKELIPIPPLPEQEQIVAKIEELFSELDAGVANIKKAQEQLKVYRQSLLKWAFEGKLTNEDDYSDWQIKKLGDVCKLNPKPSNPIDPELKIQFVPMKLVEEVVNKINLVETRKYCEVKKGSYTYFEDNDILFAKVTPCMENGKIAVAQNLKNGIGYGSSEFHVIRCSKDVLNKYIFYYVVQERFRKNAAAAMTGAVGLRRVPKSFLEESQIPIPPLPEQLKIVEELESRLTVCDNLEEDIKFSLARAESLRQSILKQAFEGKLLNFKGETDK